MIHQIIHPWFRALGRAEIYSIRLAHLPHLFPRAGEPEDQRVEFGQVGFEHRGRVARGIARYEEWEEGAGPSGAGVVAGEGG